MRTGAALGAVVAAAAVAAGAWWFVAGRPAAQPPAVPALVEDPAIRTVLGELTAAVADAPRDGEVWARLALAYQAQEMYAEANRCWPESLALGPDTPRRRWLHAVSLEGERRTAEAVAEAEPVLRVPGGHAPACARVAGWIVEGGDPERAEEIARRAADLAPRDPGVQIALAHVLVECGKADEAERAARRALSSQSLAPRAETFAHFVLGRALARLGRDDEALRETARGRGSSGLAAAIDDPWLSDLDPYRVGFLTLVHTAHALVEVADYGSARAVLEELRRRDPDHLQVAIDLGRTLRETGDAEASRDLLAAAVARFPASSELRVELALTRERLGDGEGALREIAEGLASTPASGALLETRGLIHLRADRRVEAVRDFEAALGAEPSRTWVLVHAGVAWLEAGDADRAAEAFARCVKLDPGLADAEAGLAIVAARRGEVAEAGRRLAASRALESRTTTLQSVAEEEIDAARRRR